MFDRSLHQVNERLNRTLTRNQVLQQVTDQTRSKLQVSRVVIYYFYREWKGQVIIESLNQNRFSILGSTGADDCFTEDYAQQYLQGKILQIADVGASGLDPCHLTFLASINVQADLVAPIIVQQRLWGLLAAHHHEMRPWSIADVEFIKNQAQSLSTDLQQMG